MSAERPIREERRLGLAGLNRIHAKVRIEDIPGYPYHSIECLPLGCIHRDFLVNHHNFPKFKDDLPFDQNGEIEVTFSAGSQGGIYVSEMFSHLMIDSPDARVRPAGLALVYASAFSVFKEKKAVARIVCLSEQMMVSGRAKVVVFTRLMPEALVYKEDEVTRNPFVIDVGWKDQLWDYNTYFPFIQNVPRAT